MSHTLPSGRKPYLPGGWRYDGATQDWALDATGQVRGVHWLDEGVALALTAAAGSIPSSPGTGNRIKERLRYLGGENVKATVEACVFEAQPIARYIANGWMLISRVEVESEGSRLRYAVHYRNLLETSARQSEQRFVWYT